MNDTRYHDRYQTAEHASEEPLKEELILTRGFNPNSILKQSAYRNTPLSFEDAYALGLYALAPYRQELQQLFQEDPRRIEAQSIALLCALHNQHTYRQPGSGEQIAGIAAAVFEHDMAAVFSPNVPFAFDNCGMGGDLYRTPNVSTLAALIAAADGIPMAKHGSPGNTDAAGSSDFLELSGAQLFAPAKVVATALETHGFCYTDALDPQYKTIHRQTHSSAKLAHMNDIIGPITNPLDPSLLKRRVLGVNHLLEPKTVAEAYQILNERGITSVEHALFVRGFIDHHENGGIDEISVYAGGTSVAELHDGRISTYRLKASDFGISAREYTPPPAGREGKVTYSTAILSREVHGHARDLVLANAAVLEYLAHGTTFSSGFRNAKEVLDSGKPAQLLEAYVDHTRCFA